MTPKELPKERIYSITFYLAVAVIAAVLLTGCGEENPPEPRTVCTQVTGFYACGRGGTCEQCGHWQIGCPKPLELKAKPETGALICRLKESSDETHETVPASTPMASPLR